MGLKFGIDSAPHAADTAAERLHATDRGDCNERHDQAIFNCSCSVLICT